MKRPMKKTDPKLLKALEKSAEKYRLMTPAQQLALHEAQAASWARQDMD